MKMRVMYLSSNKQFKTYAEAIGQACNCLVNDIPPAYPADNEKLVLIGISSKGKLDDKVRRFASELIPSRSKNVALFIDGSPDSDAEKELKNILINAGTNYIDEPYFVKCGIFGSKISLENRQDIVDWARKIQDIAVNK